MPEVSLLDCSKPDCDGKLERVGDPPDFEGKHGTATPVNGDFTVRCPKCEATTPYNDDNLRQQYRDAAAEKNEVVAGEIREALEAWGFAAG